MKSFKIILFIPFITVFLFINSCSYQERVAVNLYMKRTEANETYLVPKKCDLIVMKNISDEEFAKLVLENQINAEKSGPDFHVEVNWVKIKGDTATADLSSKLGGSDPGPVNERLKVYAVVACLTDIQGINKVYITIKGEEYQSAHARYYYPLKREDKWIRDH